jgi:predicted nucleic acid-binding protein
MVIDASMAGTWLLPDEANTACTAIGQRVVDGGAEVPDLFWHEIRNLLIMGVQRKRITESQFWQQLTRIENMPVQTAPQRSSEPVAKLALKHNLTSYDAAYLDLAIEKALPLATLDRKLRVAALAENVTLLPPELG